MTLKSKLRHYRAVLCKALAGQPKDVMLFRSHFPERHRRERLCGRILEAALWCFLQTESFRDAILRAVNLGDDADTTAAVCGQIAGAYYGESGIPEAWRQRVVQYELIAHFAERLLAAKAQL